MAVDKTLLIRNIQNREDMIVAFCAYTNMPFVVCDPETFNDQVWIFENETLLQEFAKPYTEKKVLLKGMKYSNKNFLGFFSMLYNIGVNELVFVNESGQETLELTELVQKRDFSKLPKEQQPIENPELQLTGIYFMQEAARPVPNEEKEGLKDLEEEFAANLVKSRYIVPIELLEGPESDVEKLKNRKYKLPILKNKKEEIMQPIFSDALELSKFNRENKFKALAVPFADLSKLLVKDSGGFMLNPAGFHVAMPKALLEGLQKRFSA
jgi:hypothetical protein